MPFPIAIRIIYVNSGTPKYFVDVKMPNKEPDGECPINIVKRTCRHYETPSELGSEIFAEILMKNCAKSSLVAVP